jgi:hypothetical protein
VLRESDEGATQRQEITDVGGGELGFDEKRARNSIWRDNQDPGLPDDEQHRHLPTGQLVECNGKGEAART